MAELFRVTAFGEPRGPWRNSRTEAMQDAIAEGLASWDQSRREWFLPVPAEIERSGRRDAEPDKKDRRGEAWTGVDIARLREFAEAGEGPTMLALRLRRTPSAVRSKARELGIAIGRAGK